ncbi:MAG: phosphoglucomutase, partial [Sphaerochaeta sp.]
MDRPEDTLVPTADPLAFEIPSQADVHCAYRQMIISSSGWRTVFAKSGDEEDSRSAVAPANRILTALAAAALYRFLDRPTPTILVGLDARPTGSTLGPIVIRTLLSLGAKVRYLAITPAPQIMADTNLAPDEADAFFYISASHNPIGHNGFKFGKAGGVFGSADAAALAEGYEALVNDWEEVFTDLVERSAALDSELYKAVFDSVSEAQKQSARRYRNLALQIATKSEESETHRAFIDTMKRSRQIGILGELNGSARSVSIDRALLTELGVKTHFINDTPGLVVHPIVPEGENLTLCM